MSEFTSHIASEPANKVMNNTGDFYSVPRYEWFGEPGTQQYRFPPTFRPDFGAGTEWDMDWTNDGGSETDIKNNWVTRRDAPWKIPVDLANDQMGFTIHKPSTAAAKEIPVVIEGGVGHWMPAPIYRNIAWWWQNETGNNSNWIVRTPGLVLRNWRTNEKKTYSIGWNTRQGGTGTNGTSYVVSGIGKATPVNQLGPDWFVYGVMFHMRSKSTQANQSPRGFLVDVTLGWHNPDITTGSNKLIIPDKMSWDDFRAMKQRGEVSFYILNSPSSASISTDVTSARTGQKINISWEAEGGSKYILHGIRDGIYNEVYDAVSASGTYEYYSNSTKSIVFTIKVLDSNDNIINSADTATITIAASTATISSSNTNPELNEQYVLTWNCVGGNTYKLNNSSKNASGSQTNTRRDYGSITYTIKAISVDGTTIVAQDSVTMTTKTPPEASISSNQTQAGEGETFRISWTASGGSSYKLYDSRDGSRYTVSANSSKDFTASSIKSTRSFTIEVYDSSGTKVKTESVNVAQLGSGKKWYYSSTVTSGNGKWGSGSSKSKFHNTDADNIDQRTWWNNFSAGTRKVKFRGSYYEVYMPEIDNVAPGSGGIASFNVIISWPFTYPPAGGSELVIFDLPD